MTSGSNLFLIPEFGYNRMIGWDMSLGVSVYGNGGMNTDFNGGQIGSATACANAGQGFNAPSGQAGPYNMLCGSGKLGMNLTQLIIAPTFAKKINKDNSLGVSLLVAAQQFKAEGLSGFLHSPVRRWAVPRHASNNLTDRGNDTTYGYGLKLGWMGKASDTVTLGASYTSKVKMGKFEKYQDLFAGQGSFDMPASLSLGIAFNANPKWTIAADFERIDYSGIDSLAIRAPMSAMPWRQPDSRSVRLAATAAAASAGAVSTCSSSARIPVQPEADPARRLQPQRQPDPGTRRDLQHDRPGRGPESCDLGIHL